MWSTRPHPPPGGRNPSSSAGFRIAGQASRCVAEHIRRPAASALEAQPAAGASTLHTTLALSMDHFSAAGNLAERVWRRCTTACTPHRADRVCSARHGATTRPPPHALQTCAGAVAGEAGRIGTSRERVVARPLARQLSEEFKRACAPFQDALGTEAGADALVRAARVPWREA